MNLRNLTFLGPPTSLQGPRIRCFSNAYRGDIFSNVIFLRIILMKSELNQHENKFYFILRLNASIQCSWNCQCMVSIKVVKVLKRVDCCKVADVWPLSERLIADSVSVLLQFLQKGKLSGKSQDYDVTRYLSLLLSKRASHF